MAFVLVEISGDIFEVFSKFWIIVFFVSVYVNVLIISFKPVKSLGSFREVNTFT